MTQQFHLQAYTQEKCVCPLKHINRNVYRGFIPNSPKVETTQIATKRKTEKLQHNTKESIQHLNAQTTNACNKMPESLRYYVAQKKGRYCTDSMYINFGKR